MITAQYSSTVLIFIMSSSVVQLFLLALISTVTADGITRIANGNVADPGQFPFLASIRIKGVHICGGSIINSRFILTSGHCARREDIRDMTVVTGSVQLSKGGLISEVANIVNAKENDNDLAKENDNDLDTDIGLIKLAVPLEYDQYTAPIKYSSDLNLPNDDFGTVIGWGSIRTTETTASDTLKYMYAYITDMGCGSFYNAKHIICTNNGPTYGVCHGDNGSPLIYGGKVIGVVSRAVLCAKGFPDAYSSIAHNINFIRYAMATA